MRFAMLRAAMLGAGYKQSEVAEKIGISPVAFSRRMNGKYPFSLDEVYKLLELLKLPSSEIHTYFPKGGKAQ